MGFLDWLFGKKPEGGEGQKPQEPQPPSQEGQNMPPAGGR